MLDQFSQPIFDPQMSLGRRKPSMASKNQGANQGRPAQRFRWQRRQMTITIRAMTLTKPPRQAHQTLTITPAVFYDTTIDRYRSCKYVRISRLPDSYPLAG